MNGHNKENKIELVNVKKEVENHFYESPVKNTNNNPKILQM